MQTIETSIANVRNANIPDIEKLLICCLIRNGLRVSEICDTSLITLINNTQLAIYQPKTRETRIVHIHEYNSIITAHINARQPIRWNRNRFYYYRLFKRYGWYEYNPNAKHQKVTHAPRHQLVNQLFEATKQINAVKNAIGHKSKSSTEHYLTKTNKQRLKQSEPTKEQKPTTKKLRPDINSIIIDNN